MLRPFKTTLAFLLLSAAAWAQTVPPDAATSNAAAQQQANTTAAAAVVASEKTPPRSDLLEHAVDSILGMFDVRTGQNTTTHFVIAAVFIVGGLLLRRVVTALIFKQLKRFASKTETTLDDKLFSALEGPVATFIMLVGIFSAAKVLKLSRETDEFLGYGSTVAFSLVLFWGLLRAFSALLDHGQEIAVKKNMGIAAFMPWIKKSLVVVFVIFGVLLTAQSLGFEVKTFLAGLGIGGLAFALAAQDTIANLFGSIVVAIDQPFKIGEAVKIGANEGTVEDIGLRSTKLRAPGKNLIIIPNKMVAAEPVINNSRFIRRRVEQVFGLTYDTSAEKMQEIVTEIRGIIEGEKEVVTESVHVYFRDFSASSMDVWIAYETRDPDFAKHMALRQRVNFAVMRAVQAKGLGFAFPTQTMNLPSGVAELLAAAGKPASAQVTNNFPGASKS
ncbi:mechanosensitive ion channel family protein [Oleiharenicola lentus]|uniref:mechanosensitive ion channel family protein n=1 Tax=Oleiharenicola lentus TaxID=2508720 RepID=UPI003F67CD8D